jgi:hypothetical protein
MLIVDSCSSRLEKRISVLLDPHRINLSALNVLLDEELKASGPVLKQCLANPSQSLPEKLNFYYALLNTLRAARHGQRAEKLLHDARSDQNKASLLSAILAISERQLLKTS